MCLRRCLLLQKKHDKRDDLAGYGGTDDGVHLPDVLDNGQLRPCRTKEIELYRGGVDQNDDDHKWNNVETKPEDKMK